MLAKSILTSTKIRRQPNFDDIILVGVISEIIPENFYLICISGLEVVSQCAPLVLRSPKKPSINRVKLAKFQGQFCVVGTKSQAMQM